MIVSHKHKYIYLKTPKTAGTSIEIALRPFCGNRDIVTPLTYPNQRWDDADYDSCGWNCASVREHSKKPEVVKVIGQETWNKYFTFAGVRNPWDAEASLYWWTVNAVIPSNNYKVVPRGIEEFLQWHVNRGYGGSLFNKGFIFDGGGFAVDDFIRYERLDEDCRRIFAKIGLPFTGLSRTKSKTRPVGMHYSEIYTDVSRRMVEEIYADTIQAFGYEFEDKRE